MTPSTLLLDVAHRAPSAMRPVVRLWARMASPASPHWLLKKLHSQLGLSTIRRLALRSGGSIHADPFDIIGQTIARQGAYEPELAELIRSLLEPGMVCVDAGAHIGVHAMTMASAVKPNGKVFAFEPAPKTYRTLQRNLRLHRLDNVDCAPVALSDREGGARLHFGEEGPQNSLGLTVHASANGVSVSTETLDRFASRSKIERLDLIKADVEGAELLLLRGARATLARFRPHLILEYSLHCAAFGYRREDISDFLVALGYVLFRVGDRGLQPLATLDSNELYCNVVAVHGDSLDRLISTGVLPRGVVS